ncbi:hypothetical protein POM88_034704 [Heracleum sosnowskyi]|uniref:DUF3700 domain-containing protein n=1 Tax=Heracleum sosnowskyi TaxID=360622 RepID=A0AAD8MD85_9APIA|nr:hypothetical protein POM88_034704 [Heracleum sosnowskyi]
MGSSTAAVPVNIDQHEFEQSHLAFILRTAAATIFLMSSLITTPKLTPYLTRHGQQYQWKTLKVTHNKEQKSLNSFLASLPTTHLKRPAEDDNLRRQPTIKNKKSLNSFLTSLSATHLKRSAGASLSKVKFTKPVISQRLGKKEAIFQTISENLKSLAASHPHRVIEKPKQVVPEECLKGFLSTHSNAFSLSFANNAATLAFAPSPTPYPNHSEGGLMSFEHPTNKLKALPRVDSEGFMCGSNFKVDVYSKTKTIQRVGSEANWVVHCLYNAGDDGYGVEDVVAKDTLVSLLVEPIPL